jgi:3-oxoadipate enol-lactonase
MTHPITTTQQGFLDVPGGRLYYEVDGARHPLTLLHAGLAHLRMWDPQVRAFAERYRVIRYDYRGYGRTTTEDVPFSNRDDLRALLDHLGIERTHLLGLSRGAMIALDFALESPDRVSALVWVAGGVGGFEGPPPPREVAEMFAEMDRLWEAKDWDALAELDARIFIDGFRPLGERVDPVLRRQVVEWDLGNYRTIQGVEGRPIPLEPPADARLADLRIPTLVMWGDADEPGVGHAGARLLEAVSGARRHVFPGVAHMVNLERPEEFERLVLDFLAGVDATAGRAGGG